MATTGLSLSDLRGTRRRRRREVTIRGVFLAAGLVTVLISAAIVVSLVGKAITFLSQIEPGQLWGGGGWFPRRGRFDIKTILAGTLVVSFIAMAVAAPLGLGSAIYLSEFASPRARRFLKPILEILAGIPSVVMGFFALTVISPDLVQRLSSSASIFNLAAAGIGVGILTIPFVATVAEDAMHAVPQPLREASFGLGAKKMTTSLRVVFPAAISGVVAALIVGLSRAVGETMVVAIAAGGTGGARFTVNPLDSGQTMTAAMMAVATGSDQVAGNVAAVNSLFFVGLVLFGLTLALNVASERFVRKFRRRY